MSSARPVRVAVVNDYELVVAGVASLLAPYADRVVIVELDTGLPVVSDVDVVLYDTFGHPQGGGLDLDRLCRDGSAQVAVYSWNTDPDPVRRALQQGAAAYLSKQLSADEIVDALERVHAGETVLPVLEDDPDDRSSGAYPGREHGLTPREAEVLALITQGLSNQEIADRSYLSINSVKTYVRTAYRRIGVARRTQAVAWGMQHGFAPDRTRVIDRTRR